MVRPARICVGHAKLRSLADVADLPKESAPAHPYLFAHPRRRPKARQQSARQQNARAPTRLRCRRLQKADSGKNDQHTGKAKELCLSACAASHSGRGWPEMLESLDAPPSCSRAAPIPQFQTDVRHRLVASDLSGAKSARFEHDFVGLGANSSRSRSISAKAGPKLASVPRLGRMRTKVGQLRPKQVEAGRPVRGPNMALSSQVVGGGRLVSNNASDTGSRSNFHASLHSRRFCQARKGQLPGCVESNFEASCGQLETISFNRRPWCCRHRKPKRTPVLPFARTAQHGESARNYIHARPHVVSLIPSTSPERVRSRTHRGWYCVLALAHLLLHACMNMALIAVTEVLTVGLRHNHIRTTTYPFARRAAAATRNTRRDPLSRMVRCSEELVPEPRLGIAADSNVGSKGGDPCPHNIDPAPHVVFQCHMLALARGARHERPPKGETEPS